VAYHDTRQGIRTVHARQLARRPGQNKPYLTTATIAHRLGTLRMFFVRLDEWTWDEPLRPKGLADGIAPPHAT
jgi:hypothetical protein